MKEIQLVTTVYEYQLADNELSDLDMQLIEKARKAAMLAYSPYSHFSVGAALVLEDGHIIMGNNQENAAYPSGLCAERVALFYANANHPDKKVTAIAVTAFSNGKYLTHPVPPCGSCRQVILETEDRFDSPIKILLAGEESVQIVESAQALLPIKFDKKYLSKKAK